MYGGKEIEKCEIDRQKKKQIGESKKERQNEREYDTHNRERERERGQRGERDRNWNLSQRKGNLVKERVWRRKTGRD
jgi:hypothetical protein